MPLRRNLILIVAGVAAVLRMEGTPAMPATWAS
jgi:hypothetical protein